MSQPIVFQRLDELLDRVEVVETIIDSGGGDGELVIPIGSQIQAGILRLATDAEVQGDNNILAATAGQVAGAKTAAAIANAGVSTIAARVDAIEAAGGAAITVSSTGGLVLDSNGLAIKRTSATPPISSHTSGLNLGSAGIGLTWASATYIGGVRTVVDTNFSTDSASFNTYDVPRATAHQALYNRVSSVEASLGDINTALAAFLRI